MKIFKNSIRQSKFHCKITIENRVGPFKNEILRRSFHDEKHVNNSKSLIQKTIDNQNFVVKTVANQLEKDKTVLKTCGSL